MKTHGSSDPRDLRGKLLAGRYDVQDRLGHGGMATIYSAYDRTLDQTVVVKVPHWQLLLKADFAERFAREVQSLTQLRHPHIVHILDLGEHDGVPFAVVEYLGRGDLSDRIAEAGGHISPASVAGWLVDVARTLDFVHSRQVVHRDVKPANILFDDESNVFLSDFGIATAMQGIDPDETVIDRAEQLTSFGGFVGSENYAPPEALQRELTPAYDQYSLGVTVYETLSGQLPTEQGETPEATLADKMSVDPIPLSKAHREISGQVERVVMKAIARDPRDRFGSCEEFADAFVDAAKQSGWRPRHYARAVLGLGLGLGIAVAAVSWLVPVEPSEAPVSFKAGSTPDEIHDALTMCRAFAPDCKMASYADETLREVTIEPFVMDATEVTNAQFEVFVAANPDYETQAERAGFSHLLGYVKSVGPSWRNFDGLGAPLDPNRAVTHVSLEDARAYCAWRGQRLPTEDEWEFKARGQERRIFPWGDAWDGARINWGDSDESALGAVGTHPTGSTPEGVHDLAGGVWEWTATPHGEGKHVLKGGSWTISNPANLRAAARTVDSVDFTSDDVGFRCVEDS